MGKGAERAPVELMPAHIMAFKQRRAHNFSAGAAMFDTNVMAHMQNNFLSYDDSGMGLFVSPAVKGFLMQRLAALCRCPLRLNRSSLCRVMPGNEPEGSWRACAELHRPGGGKPQNASRYT